MQKRRNTTRACEECRRRRAKCDGEHPSCSRCTSRSLLCTYPTQSDGRKPAPKSYVEMLRKRIDILERALKANALDVEESIGQILQENTEDPKNAENDVFQNNMYLLSREPSSTHATALSSRDSAAGSRSVDLLCEQIEGTLTIEKSLNFDQDGEIRYFGPSSGRLHFQAAALCDVNSGSSEPTFENSQRSGKANVRYNQLVQSLLDEYQVTDDLKYHLIKLYFTWEHPWYRVVDERLFRESEKSGGRFCSPLLLNCILALGSRFTDRVEVRSDPADPNTAGNIFLDNAEVLLHYDLKCPSITTIQALSIMGTIYVGQGADASGWLHQGMANRLAIDMGLNLDAASTKVDALISAEEIELRRQIYWALYCEDKLFASYTGRVCTFLTSQGAVNLPGLESNIQDRKSIWSFDTDEDMPLLTIRTDFFMLHHALIKLCRILETILMTLYAPKPLTNNEKRKAFLLSCALELRTWYYDLPPDMRIDHTSSSVRIPQVFTVHMVYHTAIILLYKPFLTDSRPTSLDKEVSSSETQRHVADDTAAKANHACYQAARGICAVSQKYRHIFGSFRRSPLTATHCNLMAALILVQAKGPAAENKKSPFNICVEVLEELSTSWNPAQRLLQNVLTLHRNSKRFETSIQEGSHSKDYNIGQDSVEQGRTLESQKLSESNTGIIDFEFPGFQTQVDHYDMTDPWTMDTDLAMAPHLTEDDLNFSFDSLPGDYGIFDLLNHTNSQ